MEALNIQQDIDYESAFEQAKKMEDLKDKEIIVEEKYNKLEKDSTEDSEKESQECDKEIEQRTVDDQGDTIENLVDVDIKTKNEAKDIKQSEEFWDYNKKIDEQLKCHEDGEALNNLFENKEEMLREQEEKKRIELEQQEADILSMWPSISTNKKAEVDVKLEQANIDEEKETQVVLENTTVPVQTISQNTEETDMSAFSIFSIGQQNTQAVKKPWLR